MKKIYLFLFLIATSYLAQAQVKVGNNPTIINASSALEIESTDKGLLFPRVALTSTASPSPLGSFVAGMTVYNTATAGAGLTAVSPGLYFSDGTKWLAAITTAVPDATTTVKGIVQLAGDLTGTASSPLVSNNAITSNKILDGTVTNTDLAAGIGGIYKGSGSLSGNTVVTQDANTLAFTGSTVNAFSVDGPTFSVNALNDRVGIGTASPTDNLHVVGVSRLDGIMRLNSADGNQAGYISTTDESTPDLTYNGIQISSQRGNGKIVFKTNFGPEGVSERMRITGNGNVGIGTTAPNAILTTSVSNQTETGLRLERSGVQKIAFVPDLGPAAFNNLASSGDIGVIFPSATGTAVTAPTSRGLLIAPWASATSGMKITEQGRVGIGTSSPTTTLAVGREDGTVAGELRLNPTNTTTEGGQIVIGRDLTYGTRDFLIDQYGGTGVDTNPPRLRIFQSGVNEAITVSEAGRVGIGSVFAPTTPLQVNGAVRVGASTQTAADAGAGAIRYNSTSAQLEFSNGTDWRPVYAPIAGSVLNETVLSTFATGSGTGTLTFSANYTPRSNNSRLIVEFNGRVIFGTSVTAPGSGDDWFSATLNINGVSSGVAYWQSSNAAGGGSRTSGMMPLVQIRDNTSSTAIPITLVVTRVSGAGESIFASGTSYVKVTEIQN